MGKDIPVSWIPLIPRMSGPDIRGISVYVKSTYTENSWALPWSGQQVVTRVETLIFSKYLVGSRANPWHGHVVVKSLIYSEEYQDDENHDWNDLCSMMRFTQRPLFRGKAYEADSCIGRRDLFPVVVVRWWPRFAHVLCRIGWLVGRNAQEPCDLCPPVNCC